jgi:hypothetical protein
MAEEPVPGARSGDRDELADPSETDQPAEGGRPEMADLPGADTADAPDDPAD